MLRGRGDSARCWKTAWWRRTFRATLLLVSIDAVLREQVFVNLLENTAE